MAPGATAGSLVMVTKFVRCARTYQSETT